MKCWKIHHPEETPEGPPPEHPPRNETVCAEGIDYCIWGGKNVVLKVPRIDLGSNFGEIYRVLAVSFVREHFTPLSCNLDTLFHQNSRPIRGRKIPLVNIIFGI